MGILWERDEGEKGEMDAFPFVFTLIFTLIYAETRAKIKAKTKGLALEARVWRAGTACHSVALARRRERSQYPTANTQIQCPSACIPNLFREGDPLPDFTQPSAIPVRIARAL